MRRYELHNILFHLLFARARHKAEYFLCAIAVLRRPYTFKFSHWNNLALLAYLVVVISILLFFANGYVLPVFFVVKNNAVQFNTARCHYQPVLRVASPIAYYAFINIKLTSCYLFRYVVLTSLCVPRIIKFYRDAFICYKQKWKVASFNLGHPVTSLSYDRTRLNQQRKLFGIGLC